jgi:hypothetical protein
MRRGEGGGEKKGGVRMGVGGFSDVSACGRSLVGVGGMSSVYGVCRAAAVAVTGAPSVHAAPLTDLLRSSAKLPRSPRRGLMCQDHVNSRNIEVL